MPNANFIYPESAGYGVFSYIIDTGVLATHVDFGVPSRASMGVNFVINEQSTDLNGHGTHCAGTVAGNTYGIAKKSTIIGVKVLDRNGSGQSADVISGYNWVAAERRKHLKPCSVNVSIGGAFGLNKNDAVNALVDAGCFVAVAAGNSNADACNYSPSSAEKSTCVGATDSSDIRAYFSNWGRCVDIMAPGVSVLSAYIGSNTATATLSGTSMAAPHVCGVGAVYLGENPSARPSDVQVWLRARSVRGVLTDLRGCPDELLHQGCY